MNKENQVVPKNKLNIELTPPQKQLFNYALYCTQENGRAVFNIANVESYPITQLKADLNRLMDLQVRYEDLKQDRFKIINVFCATAYTEGRITIEWNPNILPHITNVKLGIAPKSIFNLD